MKDFKHTTGDLIKTNVVPLRLLRSYAGQANHISSLLFAWRPFLDCLWGAIAGAVAKGSDKKLTNAPKATIWRKQIQPTLDWITSLLEHVAGSLTREWHFAAYLQDAWELHFILDASPYGLGGVLIMNGQFIAWFSSPLSRFDECIHDRRIGNSRGQQLWEGLAILVALNLWKSHWQRRRAALAIKSDNIAALTLAGRLKAKGERTLVGKEIALLYAESSFEPKLVEHVPGVMNGFPDILSRMEDPNRNHSFPQHLRSVPESICPVRDATYYKCLAKHVE